MPGGECRPVALLGRGGLANPFHQGRPAHLCLPREEFRHSAECAAAKDGSQLAKARDAICGHPLRRSEYDPLCGIAYPYGFPATLLSGYGPQNRAARCRGRERLSRSQCDQRKWRPVCPGPFMLSARCGLLRGRNGSLKPLFFGFGFVALHVLFLAELLGQRQ